MYLPSDISEDGEQSPEDGSCSLPQLWPTKRTKFFFRNLIKSEQFIFLNCNHFMRIEPRSKNNVNIHQLDFAQLFHQLDKSSDTVSHFCWKRHNYDSQKNEK